MISAHAMLSSSMNNSSGEKLSQDITQLYLIQNDERLKDTGINNLSDKEKINLTTSTIS